MNNESSNIAELEEARESGGSNQNPESVSTESAESTESKAVNSDDLTAAQVADYLRAKPDFFLDQDELLADLSLPHESGKAISLLERQVNILRGRGNEARQKLGLLLNNARNNDQLFDTTRNLILALLRSESAAEVANIAQDQLSDLENIDYCEVILLDGKSSPNARSESLEVLTEKFKDVFRLKTTHCGALPKDDISFLFGESTNASSTALCPIIENGEIFALLALGNDDEDYFNLDLDTLFLDFIGEVIGAILKQKLD